MTPDTTALKELLEKVEAGDESAVADVILRTRVNSFERPHWLGVGRIMDGSMDAALSLMEAVLPGCFWASAVDAHDERWFVLQSDEGWETEECYDPIPARALLIAILNALISEGGDHG